CRGPERRAPPAVGLVGDLRAGLQVRAVHLRVGVPHRRGRRLHLGRTAVQLDELHLRLHGSRVLGHRRRDLAPAVHRCGSHDRLSVARFGGCTRGGTRWGAHEPDPERSSQCCGDGAKRRPTHTRALLLTQQGLPRSHAGEWRSRSLNPPRRLAESATRAVSYASTATASRMCHAWPVMGRGRLRAALLVAVVASVVVGGMALGPTPQASAATGITLEGNGYGHGHGMSQYGARYRAEDGHTYSQILAAYYPGTTL